MLQFLTEEVTIDGDDDIVVVADDNIDGFFVDVDVDIDNNSFLHECNTVS